MTKFMMITDPMWMQVKV